MPDGLARLGPDRTRDDRHAASENGTGDERNRKTDPLPVHPRQESRHRPDGKRRGSGPAGGRSPRTDGRRHGADLRNQRLEHHPLGTKGGGRRHPGRNAANGSRHGDRFPRAARDRRLGHHQGHDDRREHGRERRLRTPYPVRHAGPRAAGQLPGIRTAGGRRERTQRNRRHDAGVGRSRGERRGDGARHQAAGEGPLLQRAAGEGRGHHDGQGRQLHELAQRQGRRRADQRLGGRRRRRGPRGDARREVHLQGQQRPLRDRRRADDQHFLRLERRRSARQLRGFGRRGGHQPRRHRVDLGADGSLGRGPLRLGRRQRRGAHQHEERRGRTDERELLEQHDLLLAAGDAPLPEPLRQRGRIVPELGRQDLAAVRSGGILQHGVERQ